jgi:hypothetical protein
MKSRWVWILAFASAVTAVACGSSSGSESAADGGDAGLGEDGSEDGGADATQPEASPLEGSVSDTTMGEASTDATMPEGGDAEPVEAGADATDAGTGDAADASPDAPTDAQPGPDAAFDATTDASGDASSDATADVSSDAATAADAATDAPPDANEDATNPCAGVTCTASDACHVAGVCDPSTGICSNPNATDGTSCTSSTPCTLSATCQAGTCTGTACASGLCGTSLAAFGGTQTPLWSLNGSASYDTATNTVVLADGTSNGQAGTAIYEDAITVDAFTVSFDFRFTTTNGRADGIAFMIETGGPAAVGSGYGGFGVLGLSGYGVELDIFDSGPCDPGNGNHASVDLLSTCSTNSGIPSPIAVSGDLYNSGLPNNGVGDIADGNWRTATIQLASGQMSITVTDFTGAPVTVGNLQGVALPGFVSGAPYYLGLGAGNGSNGLASREEIRNVTVTFGTTHCL